MPQQTKTGLPTLGEVVLAWRKAKQLSSTQLANKAGVRLAYLSEIEHNKTQYPREEYLEKLAIALGLEVQDIYARRMPPENGDTGETTRTETDGEEAGNKKAVAGRTTFRTPLYIKRQKILMHRLGIAEKKLDAVGQILKELYEEIREVRALVSDMQSDE
jgi:transcriptional regulator with XRE-family HTH domain